MTLSDEQAAEYLNEARLTLKGAGASFEEAISTGEPLWANVVKNAYDAMEQAISGAIAKKGIMVPKDHPEKVRKFIDIYALEDQSEIADVLLRWVWKRSRAQYIDFRKGKLLVPHTLFGKNDAEIILADAGKVIDFVEKLIK